MSYKPRFQHDHTKVIGVRNIKNNFVRRIIMIATFLPVVAACVSWNLFRACCWLIWAICMSILTLGESVYIHWNYQGDKEK